MPWITTPIIMTCFLALYAILFPRELWDAYLCRYKTTTGRLVSFAVYIFAVVPLFFAGYYIIG